jgi:hypothetical protein
MGAVQAELRDNSAPILYVDTMTEIASYNGVVYLSLGSIINEPDNPPVVDVACRLRFSLSAAQSFSKSLSEMIETAVRASNSKRSDILN